MKSTKVSIVLLGVLVAALTGTAHAAWSVRPTSNLVVADRPNIQTVPKVAATPDGGCYIGWFDPAAGSFQLYLQRLDAGGHEQWPHNGLLISDHPQDSWLVDWDLISDSQGNAVLAFSDIRSGIDFDVYAYRISPAGEFLWGLDGIPLSENADFNPAPRIAETTDGAFIITWARYPPDWYGAIMVQKLSATGEKLFGPTGLQLLEGFRELPGFCAVVPAEEGSFIVSWIRDINETSELRHLHAQKFLPTGAPAWPRRVVVCDGIPMPLAYTPVLKADGAGGAVLAWHGALGMGPLQCFVQRLSATGGEMFPHNGINVCPVETQNHVDPVVVFHEAQGDIYVFWNERDATQNWRGICGQRVSLLGNLLWGNKGMTFVPLVHGWVSSPRAVSLGNDALVIYTDQPAHAERVLAMRIRPNGQWAWPAAPVFVSTAPTGKNRLPIAQRADGVTIVVWEGADICVQNVNPNGTLGSLGDLNCDSYVNFGDIDPFVAALGGAAAYEAQYPNCVWRLADVNGDNFVSFGDIDAFVALLGGA